LICSAKAKGAAKPLPRKTSGSGGAAAPPPPPAEGEYVAKTEEQVKSEITLARKTSAIVGGMARSVKRPLRINLASASGLAAAGNPIVLITGAAW
jgi:hypothetical protein